MKGGLRLPLPAIHIYEVCDPRCILASISKLQWFVDRKWVKGILIHREEKGYKLQEIAELIKDLNIDQLPPTRIISSGPRFSDRQNRADEEVCHRGFVFDLVRGSPTAIIPFDHHRDQCAGGTPINSRGKKLLSQLGMEMPSAKAVCGWK